MDIKSSSADGSMLLIPPDCDQGDRLIARIADQNAILPEWLKGSCNLTLEIFREQPAEVRTLAFDDLNACWS